MLGLLDTVGAHLQRVGLAGAGSGWWLAKGLMPPHPDRVVALFEYAGQPPSARAHLDRPGLQVRVRGRRMDDGGNEYSEARATIENIYLTLHAQAESDVGDDRIMSLVAVQSPFPLGLDANNRLEFAVNFICLTQR